MRYNAFLTHSVVVSFPTKFISIGISNPTPVPLISFAAARQMLDQLQDFASSFADTEMQCQLATITEKLQDMRLKRRKQASIKDFFSTKFSV